MKTQKHNVVLSSALRRLLCDHQTVCSADCCKAMAFLINEASIARWLSFERIDRTSEIATEIASVEGDIRGAEGNIVLAARGLESEWSADEFRAFWNHFQATYVKATVTRQPSPA